MRPAVLALLLCAAPAAADDFTPRVGDSHFGYHRKGRRVATLAESLSYHGAGADAHYLYTFKLNVRRESGRSHAALRAEFDGRPPFALRLATYSEHSVATDTRTVTVECTTTGYDAVLTQSGETHRIPSAVARVTLRDISVDEAWLTRDPPAGATVATTEFDWAEARTDSRTLRSLGRAGGVVEYETVGSRGRVAVTRFDPATRKVVGGVFPDGTEFRAEPPTPTWLLDEPEPPPSGEVPTDRPLGPGPYSLVRVTLRGYAGTGLQTGAGQKVERRPDGSWVCRLGKGEGSPQPVTEDDARAALTETARFPFRHPKLAELARRAVGSARAPTEKVARLVQFVHVHIRYEASATPDLFDLLGTRRGNCQSFALLFVALARAEGLPAREVDGLAYGEDAGGGFGGHRWAEVAFDGVWHPVDPTAGVAELDAAYIRLDDDWPDGMTVTVDEVVRTSGLPGQPVRGVGPRDWERTWVWVGFGMITAVVVYRTRRRLLAGAHREAPAEPGGDA